ncbi:MAG: hypothetical protein KAJ63_00855 [Methyloprofundus sp.]|nr:hypothetical protein [Methyloprofundus sp.]
MKKLFILPILIIFLGSFNISCYGSGSNQFNDDDLWKKQTSILAKDIIRNFLKAGTQERFEMMSSHYQGVTKNAKSLGNSFDKESYEVDQFIEVTPFIEKRKNEHFVYVRAMITWHFEGYDGVQTCHFQLTEIEGNWHISWVLC